MQNTLQSVSASSESALSVFLKLVIVGPLIEELLFRYLVMKRLQRYGTGFAILSTSILFMFYHMNFPQFPYTLLFGLILGILTCYYSFFWSVTMHSLNNAFSFMQLVLSRFSITIIGFLGYIVFVAALIVIIEGRKEVLGVVKDRFIREFGNLRLINVLFKNVWFIIFVSLSLFGAAKMLSRL
jgi:membrane protease YdiL (CAAX protease family)